MHIPFKDRLYSMPVVGGKSAFAPEVLESLRTAGGEAFAEFCELFGGGSICNEIETWDGHRGKRLPLPFDEFYPDANPREWKFGDEVAIDAVPFEFLRMVFRAWSLEVCLCRNSMGSAFFVIIDFHGECLHYCKSFLGALETLCVLRDQPWVLECPYFVSSKTSGVTCYLEYPLTFCRDFLEIGRRDFGSWAIYQQDTSLGLRSTFFLPNMRAVGEILMGEPVCTFGGPIDMIVGPRCKESKAQFNLRLDRSVFETADKDDIVSFLSKVSGNMWNSESLSEPLLVWL